MKKEYIQPMALVKEMQGEQVLTGNSILSVEGDNGIGKLQGKDATGDAMGKQSIWDFMSE